MKLTLVTPEKRIVLGTAIDEVTVPAFRGELNVLPGHAPLMTTVTAGVLKYREAGSTEVRHVAVSRGYCQVYADGVNVLAEFAELPGQVDVASNQAALKKAEDKLANESLTDDELERTLAIIAEAKANLEVVAFKQ